MKLPCLAIALLGSSFAPLAVAQAPEGVPPAHARPAESPDVPSENDPFAPNHSTPKNIQVQVEHIELSHEALTKLLFLAEPKTTDAAALRKQLQELVAKNEAKVLETQILVAKSAQKSTTEAIHEFIYPTEFTPLMFGEQYLKNQEKEPTTSAYPANPATPTAFDTRNVGSSLETEAAVDEEGKTIDLRLVTELVWHTGNVVWQDHKDEAGNTYQVQMPDMYALRATTSVSCISGQYTLLAVLSPKDAKGETDMTRKVVTLVKCDVLDVK